MSVQQTDTDTDDAPIIYIGFWPRFIAFIIDSIAASLILTPLAAKVLGELVVSDYDLSDPVQLTELLGRLATQSSFSVLLTGTIFVLFWIFRNATPGKMLFKAVIVDAKTLQAPTVMQNILRYLAYYVSLLPFGLGFLWIAFDQRKQGWHDKIARTVVIKGKPREG